MEKLKIFTPKYFSEILFGVVILFCICFSGYWCYLNCESNLAVIGLIAVILFKTVLLKCVLYYAVTAKQINTLCSISVFLTILLGIEAFIICFMMNLSVAIACIIALLIIVSTDYEMRILWRRPKQLVDKMLDDVQKMIKEGKKISDDDLIFLMSRSFAEQLLLEYIKYNQLSEKVCMELIKKPYAFDVLKCCDYSKNRLPKKVEVAIFNQPYAKEWLKLYTKFNKLSTKAECILLEEEYYSLALDVLPEYFQKYSLCIKAEKKMLNHPYAEQLLTDYARLTDGLNEQNEMEMLSSAKALSLLRRYVRHCCLSDKAEYSLLHMPYAKDILPFYLEHWPLCEIANDKIQTMPYANEILA